MRGEKNKELQDFDLIIGIKQTNKQTNKHKIYRTDRDRDRTEPGQRPMNKK